MSAIRRTPDAKHAEGEHPLMLPGSLARDLHEIGLARRSFPNADGAKRHHFIAKLILREFIDGDLPGERLWQLDKQSGKCVQTTIEGAGSRHQFYRVRDHRGELSNRDLRDGEIIIEAEKEHALTAMLHTWLALGGAMHDVCWKVARARGSEFVIGDRPLTLHDPAPPFPWSGNGLTSSPRAYALMPLSPDLRLRLDQRGEPIEQRSWSRLLTRTNLASYGWADRYVYARDRVVLEDLHRLAQSEPGSVPTPRPDPQVIFEEADPNDPDVGAEHPAGYPRGFWLPSDAGKPIYHRYTLVYTDDPRTPVIGDLD